MNQPELVNPTPGVVTVYGDLACPYASLAIAGLRGARDRLGADVRFDVRAFPLELVNRRPHDFALIEVEKAILAGLSPSMGWRRWRAAPTTWPVTTLLALEAVQAAKRPDIGSLAGSEELDSALRRALFVDSRCIALMAVVLEIAEECVGVDRRALKAALQAGVARADVIAQFGHQVRGAVRASPHVFTAGGGEWLNPGLELDHSADYPMIKQYDPAVYEEIVRAA